MFIVEEVDFAIFYEHLTIGISEKSVQIYISTDFTSVLIKIIWIYLYR